MKTRQENIARTPTQVLEAAKQIALGRGWKIQRETLTELEVRTRISAMSWGETVKVTAVENPSAPGTSQVTVASSARFQLSDWGKSGDNVSVIMAGLTGGQGYAPSRGPASGASYSPSKKFCASCGKSMPAKAVFCPGCGERAD